MSWSLPKDATAERGCHAGDYPHEPRGGERVLVAMSGGVDSSACALLLVGQGYACAGATMSLVGPSRQEADQSAAAVAGSPDAPAPDVPAPPDALAPACCSSDDIGDARAVCRRLGIPHYTFDFEDRFDECVVQRFCDAYLEGRTPNPCIDCNRYLKFAGMQRKRRELGFDYVATGHYARRRFDERTGRWRLLRAADPAKDQSYVLYHLTQDDLAHMLFPLGGLAKAEVRAQAEAAGLDTAAKAESQDICFVPDGDYQAFIARRVPEGAAAASFAPGPIVTTDGRVVGTHDGLVRYTIGQRKGIGVAASEPLYVYAKDVARNELVVAVRSGLYAHGVRAADINLIECVPTGVPFRCEAKTHYRQRLVGATATVVGLALEVVFDEPQIRSAAGQAVVLYDGDVVIGGGTITEVIA